MRCPHCGHALADHYVGACPRCAGDVDNPGGELARLQRDIEALARAAPGPVFFALLDGLIDAAIGGGNPALATGNKVRFYRAVLAALSARGVS